MPNFHHALKLVLIAAISCNNSLIISLETIQTQLILKIRGFSILHT